MLIELRMAFNSVMVFAIILLAGAISGSPLKKSNGNLLKSGFQSSVVKTKTVAGAKRGETRASNLKMVLVSLLG